MCEERAGVIPISVDMPPKRKSTGAEDASVEKKTKTGSKKAVVGKPVDASLSFLMENEKHVTLGELIKNKGVVIFMYPRANTPGCTKQACGFRDDHKEFAKYDFDVYGMSYDKPTSQLKWKTKYSLPYHLLTDESGEAIKYFGAHKAPKGVIRSHIVIGKDGIVLDVQNKISPGDSFTGALETVKAA